jgi:hypothetical protein
VRKEGIAAALGHGELGLHRLPDAVPATGQVGDEIGEPCLGSPGAIENRPAARPTRRRRPRLGSSSRRGGSRRSSLHAGGQRSINLAVFAITHPGCVESEAGTGETGPAPVARRRRWWCSRAYWGVTTLLLGLMRASGRPPGRCGAAFDETFYFCVRKATLQRAFPSQRENHSPSEGRTRRVGLWRPVLTGRPSLAGGRAEVGRPGIYEFNQDPANGGFNQGPGDVTTLSVTGRNGPVAVTSDLSTVKLSDIGGLFLGSGRNNYAFFSDGHFRITTPGEYRLVDRDDSLYPAALITVPYGVVAERTLPWIAGSQAALWAMFLCRLRPGSQAAFPEAFYRCVRKARCSVVNFTQRGNLTLNQVIFELTVACAAIVAIAGAATQCHGSLHGPLVGATLVAWVVSFP